MELSTLKPRPGSRTKRLRVGRGESSGQGKTSGTGGKGQKGRKGVSIRAGFEGGQMPLYRRISKLGFTSRQKARGLNQYQVINLSDLERFDAGALVDLEFLKKKGFGPTNKRNAGIKVLGGGTLTKKLKLKVHAISPAAKAKIEGLGGTVELIK